MMWALVARLIFLAVLVSASSLSNAHEGHDHKSNVSGRPRFSCDAALVSLDILWSPELAPMRAQLEHAFADNPRHPLWTPWLEAIRGMAKFPDAASIPESDRAYFAKIKAAAWAALGKHQLEYVREGHLDELKTPRHLKILDAIATLTDASSAKFAAYKIKREIEASYSIREYTDCIEMGAPGKLGRLVRRLLPPKQKL